MFGGCLLRVFFFFFHFLGKKCLFLISAGFFFRRNKTKLAVQLVLSIRFRWASRHVGG